MNTTTAPDNHHSESDHETVSPEKASDNKIWWRLLYMLVFVFLYGVSRVVISAVVILQFLWVVFTERTNHRLLQLGQSLATYTYQILRYLTFTSDTLPYPFKSDWPRGVPPQSP